jgi:hypothetical protein
MQQHNQRMVLIMIGFYQLMESANESISNNNIKTENEDLIVILA